MNFLRKTINDGNKDETTKRHLKKPNSKHLMTGTAIFIAAILLISGTNIKAAFADNVNTVGVTLSGGSTLLKKGDSVTLTYQVTATSGSADQSGCNTNDGTPLTLNLKASNGLTPSTQSVTFTDCGPAARKSVTFTSNYEGTTATSAAIAFDGFTDTGTADVYNFNVNFGVQLEAFTPPPPSDTTKPTVTASPTGGTFTSAKTVALTASETAKIYYTTDGSTPSTTSQSFQTTGTVTISNEGTTVLKFFAVDEAGNVGDLKTETYVIDTKAPTLTPTFSVQPSTDGWFNQPVTVTWTCQDDGTGVASFSEPSTYSGPDTAGFTITGTCADNAGNKVSRDVVIKYDATAPSIAGSLSRVPDQNGWYNDAVGYAWECTDALSGVALESQDGQYTSPDGEDISLAGSCTDKAGNSASASIGPFDFDNTNPVLVAPDNLNYVVAGPSDSLKFADKLKQVSDALSGLGTNTAQCVPAGITQLGAQSVTCTIKDVAGNEGTIAFTMNLKYGTFLIQPPINTDGTSDVKKGSTLPVKFKLFWADGVTPAAPNSLAGLPDIIVTKNGVNPPGGELETVSTSAATTGSDFRYDSASQQYIFNLSTKPSTLESGYKYLITIDLHDGTLGQRIAYFSIVR